MSDSDLMFRPASELAAMVRTGEVSSRELVECALERIEELNPSLNAFVEIDAEGALRAADAIAPGDERPFAGVPTAIKNNRPVKGMRLTYGCSLMAEYVAPYDHNVTRRLKDAGFVILGTTTLPEYGILPTSEARIFGPTRNPWDLGRTPGGSSGGAAAAVASGMLPIAHGNDGGGSVRIPAACCGLVGLKPSRGRISPPPSWVIPRSGSTGCSRVRSPTPPPCSMCSPGTSWATRPGRRRRASRSRRLRSASPGGCESPPRPTRPSPRR